MKFLRRFLFIFSILIVTVIALALRLWAVTQLPIDYDEDDYLRAAQQYQVAIQHKDWGALLQLNYRPEHPPLSKLVYGLSILSLPEVAEIPDLPTTANPASSLPEPHLRYARRVGAIAGTLEVFVLALLNPLAGFFLAIHTWQIKYTSQVMLEAIPSLTSMLAIFAYIKSRSKWNKWMVLSAVAFGLTVAAKYPYGVVGLVILGHWAWNRFPRDRTLNMQVVSQWFAPLLGFIGLSLVTFFIFDPYLWPDPFHRLYGSLFYHFGYAESSAVQSTGYPMWQQLNWLFTSVPWHQGVFVFMLDLPIAILALIGFPRLWRRQRVIALWGLVELIFLLVWPTKWPQYVLMLTAPLTFSAAEGLDELVFTPIRRLTQSIKSWWKAKHAVKIAGWKNTRKAIPWLAPGMIVLTVITAFPLLYQGAMAVTDFNILSIKDGLRGGVLREAWLGISGQVDPVVMSLGNNGRVRVTNQVEDRGEVKPLIVTETQGTFSNKDVHYTGLKTFFSLFASLGGQILVFEILWTLITVSLQTALGLVVALALNRRGVRFAGWWRTLYVLPWAIPEFVGALIWRTVFEPTNGWLALLTKHPLTWTQSLDRTLGVLVLAALWMGWPFMMLAATAGLKLLPNEVYDAAAIDGATGWNRFRWVTWPLLLPLLGPAIIIRSISAFNQFYLFYVMRTGFALSTFATISYNLFNTNNGAGAFSISAAINLTTVIFLLGLILYLNRWNQAAEEASYA